MSSPLAPPPPQAPAMIDASNVTLAYQLVLVGLSVIVVLLLFLEAGCSCAPRKRWGSSLELVFLPAYAICASADWLQGPYVYALYSSYGFSREIVNLLFMAGFLSAGLLAPFAGGIADRYGRRLACVYGYCVLYGLGCRLRCC